MLEQQPHRFETRIASVDFWRGLAAVCVMVYHARAVLWEGAGALWAREGLHGGISAWLGYLTIPFSWGGLGVPLFFVLSGFCIHNGGANRLANGDTKVDWIVFFKRRFLRIYPTYVAALVLTGLTITFISHAHHDITRNLDVSVRTLLLNLGSLQGLMSPPYGGNGVFWTLSLEIHLYLFYPVLFYMSRRYNARVVLVFSLAVNALTIIVVRAYHVGSLLPYWIGTGPIFTQFIFTWAVGFYLAEVRVKRVESLPIFNALIGLLSVGIGLLLKRVGLDDFAELFFGAGFGGLIWSTLEQQSPSKLCSLIIRLAASIGVFSYSLYAIHLPALFLTKAFLDPLSKHRSELWPLGLGCVISFAAACLLYVGVERWFIHWRPVSRHS